MKGWKLKLVLGVIVFAVVAEAAAGVPAWVWPLAEAYATVEAVTVLISFIF